MALADQLLGGFPYGFLFDVGKRHGCTRLRKRLGGCQPHARTGPGDERNLVVEVGVVVHIRLWFDVILGFWFDALKGRRTQEPEGVFASSPLGVGQQQGKKRRLSRADPCLQSRRLLA
jgi:hypothetical protein